MGTNVVKTGSGKVLHLRPKTNWREKCLRWGSQFLRERTDLESGKGRIHVGEGSCVNCI